MGKKKNKNSNQNKKAAQKKTAAPALETVSAENQPPKSDASQERYVAKRKRDVKKEQAKKAKAEAEAAAAAEAADVDTTEEHPEESWAEDFGSVFAVTDNKVEWVPPEEKRSRKKAKREKKVKEPKPPKEKKVKEPKPPKEKKHRKPKKQNIPVLTAPEFDDEKERAYKEKLIALAEWEEKFDKRLYTAVIIFAAVLLLAVILWKAEVGRISIEGKDEYEIGVNVFGMTSSIHERNASAMLKEVPIKAGTVEVVIYRIIEDMYVRHDIQEPYAEGEPILMGFYKAEKYKKYFEEHDYSDGKANMQIRSVTKEDKKNAKKYAVNIGRATLIREYTEKYGGETESNFESLRQASIMEIIDRDSVTQDVADAIASLFSDRYASGDDIPMVITENVPAEAVVEAVTPAPAVTAAPAAKRTTTTKTTTTRKSTSTTKTTTATTAPDEATAAPAAATAAPVPSMEPSLVLKPIEPVRQVSRPTANPTAEPVE